MNRFLFHKQIIVGVTGGIAAYKSADLVRRLREQGAQVRIVMTSHAKEFITPLTMQAVSGYPVHDDLFDPAAEAAMGHIELARWADAIVIAPATADFMARLAGGEANDLLTTLCLAAKAPILIAPAMNQAMWKNTLTQQNAQALKMQGIQFLGPGEGSQACGDQGYGRMVEPLEIVDAVSHLFNQQIFSGKKIVITAGPTQEAIDPVRYISNRSSGKMGYALAEAAAESGAAVVLISGPVHLTTPRGVRLVSVVSADEMLQAVLAEINDSDIFIGAAAVADYRCKMISVQKIKKTAAQLTLELERNPDIISIVAMQTPKPFMIGFAAETDDVIDKARAKRNTKKLDMIIANQVGKNVGMESDENAVTVLWENQEKIFDIMPKTKLARELMSLIASIIRG